MSGKGAPKGNQYAAKEGKGETISLYLSGHDIAFLRRMLADRGKNPDEWRKATKRLAKQGIYQAIKSYLEAEII